jgi:hypothetical protein
MTEENASRRMTLRQLLTHIEKTGRNVIDHLQSAMLAEISDLRELSRPVRRRSHYPTLVALQNALRKVLAAHQEVQTLTKDLHHQFEDIKDRSKKDRIDRL